MHKPHKLPSKTPHLTLKFETCNVTQKLITYIINNFCMSDSKCTYLGLSDECRHFF